MPDPALEAAHQFLAAAGAGRLEQACDLLAQGARLGPQLLGLRLEPAAQGLDHVLLDALGPDKRHGKGGKTDGADHGKGGAGLAGAGQTQGLVGQRPGGLGTANLCHRANLAAAGTDGCGHGNAPEKGVEIQERTGAKPASSKVGVRSIFLARVAAATAGTVISPARPSISGSWLWSSISYGIPKRRIARTTRLRASPTGSGSRRRSPGNMWRPARSCAPTSCTRSARRRPAPISGSAGPSATPP